MWYQRFAARFCSLDDGKAGVRGRSGANVPRHLGGLGLGEEVDEPLRVRRQGPGRGEIGIGQGAVNDLAAVAHLEPVQHPPERGEALARVGREPTDARASTLSCVLSWA